MTPTDPLKNPPTTPTPSATPVGPQNPVKGSDAENLQKPFTMPPEPLQKGTSPTGAEEGKLSPLDLARKMEEESKTARWTPEEMQDNIKKLKNRLGQLSSNLQNPNINKNLAPEHFQALNQIVDKMNPDMRSLAKYSGTEYQPITPKKGDGPLASILNWVNGTQNLTNNALSALTKVGGQPDPAEMLKLQFIAQRALERTELMTSVVSSSVSGIKTLMSMQLG